MLQEGQGEISPPRQPLGSLRNLVKARFACYMVTDKILDPTTDEEVDLVKTIHFSEASEIDSDDDLDTCELSKARCMVTNTYLQRCVDQ